MKPAVIVLRVLLPSLSLVVSLGGFAKAPAASVEDRLALLNQSMRLCLAQASRPGFPYYHRPEASESCEQTKSLLHVFGREANHNRNLSCSGRIAALDFDLWMIQFVGGKRMRDKALGGLRQLGRNCYNMNARH